MGSLSEALKKAIHQGDSTQFIDLLTMAHTGQLNLNALEGFSLHEQNAFLYILRLYKNNPSFNPITVITMLNAILEVTDIQGDPIIELSERSLYGENILEWILTLYQNKKFTAEQSESLVYRLIYLSTSHQRVLLIGKNIQSPLIQAVLSNHPGIVKALLELRNREGEYAIDPSSVMVGNPPQSLLDVAIYGHIAWTHADYKKPPLNNSHPLIIKMLQERGVQRCAKRNHESKVVIIQRAFKTHRAYQQILEKERKERGHFLKELFTQLKSHLDAYFAYMLLVRVNPDTTYTAELDLYMHDLQPSYERLSSGFSQYIIREVTKIFPEAHDWTLLNAGQMIQDKYNLFLKDKKVLTCHKKLQRGLHFYSSNVSMDTGLDIYPSLYQLLTWLYPVSKPAVTVPVLPQLSLHPSFQKLLKKYNKHLLYKFLCDMVGSFPNFQKKDVFVREILEKIITMLDFIVLFDNLDRHYARLVQLYFFTASLVCTAIVYEAPYQLEDYQEAVERVQRARLYIPGIQRAHYPAKSGMDALFTAFIAAYKQGQVKIISMAEPVHPDYKGYCPIYFEAQNLFQRFINQNSAQQDNTSNLPTVFVTAITSEHQTEHFQESKNFNNSIQLIKRACANTASDQHTTLLIDETISFSAEQDPVIHFIRALAPEIRAGKLNVLLCKSLQKFFSLGTSKIKFGNITLLNNGDKKFHSTKAYLDNIAHDNFHESYHELQIATYFLKNFPQNEYLFIRQASKNAAYIKQRFFSDCKAVVATGPFLQDMGITNRFHVPSVVNFGFPLTTRVPWVQRTSVGLEPQLLLDRIANTAKGDGKVQPELKFKSSVSSLSSSNFPIRRNDILNLTRSEAPNLIGSETPKVVTGATDESELAFPNMDDLRPVSSNNTNMVADNSETLGGRIMNMESALDGDIMNMRLALDGDIMNMRLALERDIMNMQSELIEGVTISPISPGTTELRP